MTIKELKEILNTFDENKEAFVFSEEESTMYEITSVSVNGGHAQLNAGFTEEEEEEILTEYEELLQKAMQTKSQDDMEALAKWFERSHIDYWNDNYQAFKLEDGLWLKEINAEYDEDGNLISREWEID